eukprot:1803241-Pyramimonas_sp.AAC.1
MDVPLSTTFDDALDRLVHHGQVKLHALAILAQIGAVLRDCVGPILPELRAEYLDAIEAILAHRFAVLRGLAPRHVLLRTVDLQVNWVPVVVEVNAEHALDVAWLAVPVLVKRQLGRLIIAGTARAPRPSPGPPASGEALAM